MSGSDFWSRRRARVAAEARAIEDAERREAIAAAGERTRAAEAADPSPETDAEILDSLGLPDPDTLDKGDDVSAFLAHAVPERLRRRALRRLWRLDPTLANLDGLVDYGEDFTDASMVIDELRTAYEVGKGMAHRLHELGMEADTGDGAAEPAATAEADDADDVAGGAAAAPDSSPDSSRAEANDDAMEGADAKNPVAEHDEGEISADDGDPTRNAFSRPGRMRYRFDNHWGDSA